MMQVDGVRITSAGDTFFASSVASAALFVCRRDPSAFVSAHGSGTVSGPGHPSYPMAVGPMGGPGYHSCLHL